MTFDGEDLALFLDECEDNVTLLENGLLSLKHGKDVAVNELFRAAHTLKGSSAMMGLTALQRVAHALEAALDEVRSGRRSLTGNVLVEALAIVDFIRLALNRLRQGEILPEGAQELAERLEQALVDETASSASLPLDAAWLVRFRAESFVAVRAYQLLRALREAGVPFLAQPDEEAVVREEITDALTLQIPRALEDEVLNLVRSQPDVVDVMRVGSGEPPLAGVETEKASASSTALRKEMAQTFVRVDLSLMDKLMNLTGELVVSRGQLNAVLERHRGSEVGREIRAVSEAIGQITAEIQEIVLATRMTPLAKTFSRFPRLVQDTAQAVDKEIDFLLEGTDTELDRSLIDLTIDPITHLLRNAVDHGIESAEERLRLGKRAQGTIVLRAYRTESSVVIEVEDDGQGIDPAAVGEAAVAKGLITREELAQLSPEQVQMLIFAPGFSTRAEANEISGRGVGMDIVRANVERASGKVELVSKPGVGTLVRLVLPFTLATARTLLVASHGHVLAIPLPAIEQVVFRRDAVLETLDGGREMVRVGEATMPLLRTRHFYADEDDESAEDGAIVVLKARARRVGLLVDALIREEEVVVKPIDRLVGRTSVFSGAAILGNGAIALIVDPEGVVEDGLVAARRRASGGVPSRSTVPSVELSALVPGRISLAGGGAGRRRH